MNMQLIVLLFFLIETFDTTTASNAQTISTNATSPHESEIEKWMPLGIGLSVIFVSIIILIIVYCLARRRNRRNRRYALIN